jgi:uncharacterized membrane protein
MRGNSCRLRRTALAGRAQTTGGSWLCYFRALEPGAAARVAPIDQLSVVLVAIFGGCSWASGGRERTGWASA